MKIRFLVLIIFLAMVFLWAPGSSMAYDVPAIPPLNAGDIIKLGDGPGTTNGGEFKVYKDGYSDPIFNTFCIEKNEYINFTDNFKIEAISTEAYKGGISGGSPDPISAETAYLFHSFFWGELPAYDYDGADRAYYADDLQKAIWYFEGEIDTYNYSKYDYVSLAENAVKDGLWSGLGDVRVLNLITLDGDLAQDQLTVVPEPATMLLVGVGLIGLAGVGRKKFITPVA